MMQNLYKDLEILLKNKSEFVVNNKLNKSKISDAAYQYDEALLKILLSHKSLKKQFFMEVGGETVFKQKDFLNFLKNKDFLPNSFTEFKNQIGLQDEKGEYFRENKDTVLVFPYKDCVLEGGQEKEDQKRNEIFYNETLAPDEITRLFDTKALTNFKLYDDKGEHSLKAKTNIDFSKQNLIIKGNNLLALHSLKGIKTIAGQVKLIYIDPPYNTGNDSFHYNDKFNHSTWLVFMKNRLLAAKTLMKYESVIAVQCSFHQYAYLKVLMDELFEKHLCTFNIQVRHPDRILTGDKEYNDVIEYILIYSKNPFQKLPKKEEEKIVDEYIYKIKETGKPERLKFGKKEVLVYTPEKFHVEKFKPSFSNLKKISIRGSIREKNSSGRFYVKYLEGLKNKFPPETLFKVPDMGDDGTGSRYFYLPPKGNVNGGYFQGKPQSSDVTLKPHPNFFNFSEEYNNVAEQGGVSFRNGKKPEELIKFLIEIFTGKNEIVIDYHLGSGTTAAVAHKMERRFIGIEQLDYEKNGSVTRLNNVIKGDKTGISEDYDINWQGGGSFIYAELKRYNQQYIDDIEAAKDTKTLKKLYDKMKEEAFFRIEVNHTKWNNVAFDKLTLKDQKRLLIDCLDKNHLYVNLSEMEDTFYKMSKDEIALNKKFYYIS
jgi:adenine-specific DNA-methyltransferase